jgi:hypothetical protein
MKPLADGLDILQGDKEVSLGYILPTLFTIRKKMMFARENLRKCQPLVTAIMKGLKKRFSHLFDDKDHILASVTIPQFKMIWIEKQLDRNKAIQLLKEAEELLPAEPEITEDAQPALRPPTFFDSFNINIQNQESGDTVSQYLISTDVELSSLAKFPRMERLYRMYNILPFLLLLL